MKVFSEQQNAQIANPLGSLWLLVQCMMVACGASDESSHPELIRSRNQGLLTAVQATDLLPSNPVGRGRYGTFGKLSADGLTAIVGQVDSSHGDTQTQLDIFRRTAPDSTIWNKEFPQRTKSFADWPTYYLSSTSASSVQAALSASGKTLIISNAGSEPTTYEFSASGLVQIGLLHNPGACNSSTFGFSIAISSDGETAAVGCPKLRLSAANESIVLFRRQVGSDGSVGFSPVSQIDSLPSDFGFRLALAGNGKTMVVTDRTFLTFPAGAVRHQVFVIDLDINTLEVVRRTKLTPDDPTDDDSFGRAIAISDDGLTVIVGSPTNRNGTSTSPQGAVYVFERRHIDGSFVQQAKLTAGDRSVGGGAGLGESVAISGDGQRLLLGAPFDGPRRDDYLGAVYLFAKQGTAWVQQKKLQASTPQIGGFFGSAVSLDARGRTGLIGMSGIGLMARWAGKAFAYAIRRSDGDACLSSSECASGFCADGVCCDQACGGSNDTDCQVCSKAKGATADGRCTYRTEKTVCRSAKGDCDQEEICTGSSADCPPDRFMPKTTVCRPKSGDCDVAEYCTGLSITCPLVDAKRPAGDVCRAAAGPCDAVEVCKGSDNACPDDIKKPKTTVCRAPIGICDRAESCSGTEDACPTDEFVSKGTACGGGTDPICDPGNTCDGVGMCIDLRAKDGTSCKLVSGKDGVCKVGACVP